MPSHLSPCSNPFPFPPLLFTIVALQVGNGHVSLARPLPLCAYWDLFNLSQAARPMVENLTFTYWPKNDTPTASQASGSPGELPNPPQVAWMSPDLFLLLARAAAAASPPTSGSDTSGSDSTSDVSGVDGLRSPAVGFVWVQSRHAQQAPFLHEPVTSIMGHLLPYAMGHVPLPSNTLDLHLPVRGDAVQVLMHAWQDKDVVVWLKTAAGMIEFDPPTGSLALESLPYSRQLHVLATSLLGTLNKTVMAVRLHPDVIAWRVKREAEQQRANASAGQQEGTDQPGSEQQGSEQPGSEQSGSEQPGSEQPGSEQPPGSEDQQQHLQRQFQQQVQWCVNASVAKASVVQQWVSVRTVFVAADVLRRRSEVKELTWMREQINNTVTIDELLPAVARFDPGVVAILDRLVCSYADVILAASARCGGATADDMDIFNHRLWLDKPNKSLVMWGYGMPKFG
ncbi:unnamed protein product [Closterium sp. Yama58-4]|nr:unnamed protein product [Closterium sp. Yama58-4]